MVLLSEENFNQNHFSLELSRASELEIIFPPNPPFVLSLTLDSVPLQNRMLQAKQIALTPPVIFYIQIVQINFLNFISFEVM